MIPVGQHFTGSMDRLVFANDHDVSGAKAESLFRNVKIHQQGVGGEFF